MTRSRAVGLFYFAGHGLQLDWRNFLVPVDVRLDQADDVPRQTVDLGNLLNSLGRAGNAMNIVVLDACRDNPFGSEHKTGRGLSQMDAPISTLLAYATAPGNVASDGTGKNGLSTENFLKEMVAPEARIEDVFKRVRLAVRRSSQGQQIPWESTSRWRKISISFHQPKCASARKTNSTGFSRRNWRSGERSESERTGTLGRLSAGVSQWPVFRTRANHARPIAGQAGREEIALPTPRKTHTPKEPPLRGNSGLATDTITASSIC
ncbi:MAG: caspase family protein [Dechloromonas sp.]|uniref:Caspase family protein n=1 Tax=Candidatus Dechloromonas phosphorivorans TaxID=2899244 RepID=A0A9D7QM36_9RHOO|nr:caspase family protein [Candidatus Dechloromonas phosphorivorans]